MADRHGRRRHQGDTFRQADLARRHELVELDRRWGLDCTRGNCFRHLNHCCAANCYLRVVARRVEIYSRGAIPAGAELTVDYRATPHPGGMACRCGAPRCRGRL